MLSLSSSRAESDLREKAAKESKTCGDKNAEEVKVVWSLAYAEEGQKTVKLRMRRLIRQECESKEDNEEKEKVVNFLSHTRCTEEAQEEGGITWVEL